MAVKLLSSKKNFHKIKLTSDQYKKKHIFEQISLPPTLTQIPLQEKPPLHPPKKKYVYSIKRKVNLNRNEIHSTLYIKVV